MKILLCHAGRGHPLPETLESLRGWNIAQVDVSHHPATYPQTLDRWWGEAEPFVNVEHDMVVPPGAIEALEECPEPWCWHCYAGQAKPWSYPALGLVRFRAEVMKECPGLWDTYLARQHGPGCNPDTMQPYPNPEVDDPTGLPLWSGEAQWLHCDEWAAAYLRLHDIPDHRHYPDAVNL